MGTGVELFFLVGFRQSWNHIEKAHSFSTQKPNAHGNFRHISDLLFLSVDVWNGSMPSDQCEVFTVPVKEQSICI